MSPDEKKVFLTNLRQDCGFGDELQLKHIEKNAPRVTVSKLSANALVGKLGKLKKIFIILFLNTLNYKTYIFVLLMSCKLKSAFLFF
jgi:hypothetical protein